MKVPNEITVLIDSREKPIKDGGNPLLFPTWIDLRIDRTTTQHMIQIKTKVVPMPAGDYTIEGQDHVSIIETKRSLRELYNNVCTKDWARTSRALKKLAEACQYPYLVLEMTPSELFRVSRFVPDPHLVFDRWMQVVARLGLRVMFTGCASQPGPRRKLGEQLVRLMLAHVFNPPGEAIVPWTPLDRSGNWEEAERQYNYFKEREDA